MMRGHSDVLDDVLNRLEYTFIDLPDLIDEEAEKEPFCTQSVYVSETTSNPHASQQQQHQQRMRQPQDVLSTAGVDGSYWQQLQQFNSMPQAVGHRPGFGPVPGSGALLAGEVQQHQQLCCQQQQCGQHAAYHKMQQQQEQQQQTHHGLQQHSQHSTQQVNVKAAQAPSRSQQAATAQSDNVSSMEQDTMPWPWDTLQQC